ncbi:hypothetical protein EON65_37205 [archaeon]|nr:MAG: hypothetical protein EON65_37205 [archaeon]
MSAYRDRDDRDDYDGGFDEIEAALLKEDMAGLSMKMRSLEGLNLDRKINLSVRVQNDITRSEKKGEKRVSNQGKDDRATSEQVLDPRTRLILFKLLSNGYLSEIDGKNGSYIKCCFSIFLLCDCYYCVPLHVYIVCLYVL